MADKEIIIGLKTVGDTSGAEAVEESLMQVEDAAKQAERELDVIEAKRRKAERETGASGKPGGLLGVDVSGGMEKAGQQLADNTGYGQEFRAVTAMVGADAAAIAGSFAAIGAAAVASYKLVSDTTQGYRQLMTDAAAAGQTINPQLAAEVERMESLLSPITGVIDTVGSAWNSTVKFFKDPVGELSGLNSVKEAMAAAAAAIAKLQEERLKIANESQSGLTTTYNNELAALKEQEATIKRIATLRNELAGVEVQRANNQIEIAQQTGGDVELARANALAVELRTGVEKLGDNLEASKNAAEQARTALDAAMVKYSDAINNNIDKLDPEQFAKLGVAVDTAKKSFDDANQVVEDQKVAFAAQKTLLLENVETELRNLDAESKSGINSAADKARTSIYETIKTEFDSIGSATGAVKTAVNANRDQTVQAIQQLAPKPADTAKVQGAVTEASQGIEVFGNTVITSLAKLSSVVSQLTQKAGQQDAKINQLFGRLR